MYIIPKLYVTDDEAEIIDLLVDNQQMPKDFSKDCFVSFLRERDFIIALFFAKGDDRGFQLFIVEDFAFNVPTMKILADSFDTLIDEGFNPPMLAIAKGQITEIIAMAATYRLLFDA